MSTTKYKQRADNELLMEIEEKKMRRVVEERLPDLKPTEPMSNEEWSSVLEDIENFLNDPEIQKILAEAKPKNKGNVVKRVG